MKHKAEIQSLLIRKYVYLVAIREKRKLVRDSDLFPLVGVREGGVRAR